MPKQKTHKGISKKLKVRAGGPVSIGRAGGNHKTGKKSRSFKRSVRAGSVLSKSDAKRLKTVIYK